MLSKSVKIFMLSGLSLVSAANVPPALPAEAVRDLAPRQTDNLLSEALDVAAKLGLTACIPVAIPLVSIIPPIPAGLINQDLLSQALSQTTLALSEVCKFSITGDTGPQFTSYLPTVFSWYSEYSSTIAGLVSKCPSASPLVQTLESYESCSQVKAVETGAAASGSLSIETDTVVSTSASKATTTAAATATAATSAKSSSAGSAGTSTSHDSSDTASPSPSVSQGQAPRETGFALAAAAMAGFIGAVAAL